MQLLNEPFSSTVAFCACSKQIIAHWKQCKLDHCDVCHPFRQKTPNDEPQRVAQDMQMHRIQVGSEVNNSNNKSSLSIQENLSNLQVDFAGLDLTSSNDPESD